MLRGIAVLAATLAALVLWDRTLSERHAVEREESGRIRKLIEDELREELVVAGIRVQTSVGEDFLYARSRGVWRLVEPPVGTYARESVLLSLVESLIEAEGVVLTDDKLRSKSYGFGSDIAIRVTLHGTQLRKAEDEDVLFCVDLGYPIPATQGAYVRPLGTHEVWAIDRNPRTALTRDPGSSFPPMLDPYVIPGSAGAVYGGFERISITRAGGESFALERQARTPQAEGEADHEWVLVGQDGSREVGHEIPTTGYSLFLRRIHYDRIIGPADLDPDVAGSPSVRIALVPLRGEPFELLIGSPTRSGGRTLVNTGTGTAFGVSQEVFDLLVPTTGSFSELEEGNPWHEYIQVNPLAGMDPLLTPMETRDE